MNRALLRRAAVGAALVLTVPAAAAPDTALGPRPDLTAAERDAVVRLVATPADPGTLEPFETMPGGAATSRAAAGPESLAQPIPGLSGAEAADFAAGRAVFRKLWVAAPSSTHGSDGLGPLFDARSCDACHVRDGRGRSPSLAGGDGFVIRLGRNHPDGRAGDPDPVYGRQVQQNAVAGLPAEGRVAVAWDERPVVLADGTMVNLRAPTYRIDDPAYGPLAPDTVLSPRVASALSGMGLLAAIDEGDIRAGADADDADGDGVSGRAATVVDPESGRPALGRFGWKASQPTLTAQTAAAFATDMGLSTPLRPAPAGDCTAAEADCLALPNGAGPGSDGAEVPAVLLRAAADYLARIAVPARPLAGDAVVLAGKRIFHAIGCAACHRPVFVTRRDAVPGRLAFQPIRPYSDLLLHDMGEGLADGLVEGDAEGREWRTPPLWGLGLAPLARGGETGYLHDGRARTLPEAILWHGGEALRARDSFAALDARDRAALVTFLKSL